MPITFPTRPSSCSCYEALGVTPAPVYAHLPLLHGPDGQASCPSVTAPRRSRSCVTQGLPARGGRQLHRTPRRRLRRRRGVLHAAAAGRPVPVGARVEEAGGIRREEAASASNGDYILRALGVDRADPSVWRSFTGPYRTWTARGRDLTGEDPDVGGLLGRWSSFLFDGPVDDPAAF